MLARTIVQWKTDWWINPIHTEMVRYLPTASFFLYHSIRRSTLRCQILGQESWTYLTTYETNLSQFWLSWLEQEQNYEMLQIATFRFDGKSVFWKKSLIKVQDIDFNHKITFGRHENRLLIPEFENIWRRLREITRRNAFFRVFRICLSDTHFTNTKKYFFSSKDSFCRQTKSRKFSYFCKIFKSPLHPLGMGVGLCLLNIWRG